MTRGIPIEAGDFFLRKKGFPVVRRLRYSSGDLWFYREYWLGFGSDWHVYEGSCLEVSLKNWGTRISPERARELVPDLADLDRQKDESDVEVRMCLNETLNRLALANATDEQIREEAERRGLLEPRRPPKGIRRQSPASRRRRRADGG